jgi:hypothetical protein
MNTYEYFCARYFIKQNVLGSLQTEEGIARFCLFPRYGAAPSDICYVSGLSANILWCYIRVSVYCAYLIQDVFRLCF